MSALPNTSQGASAGFGGSVQGALAVQVRVDVSGVLAMLGVMLPSITSALSWRMYAMMNHHIRSVMSHNLAPNKRGMQKLIATLAYSYGRRSRDVQTLDQVQGESFMASRETDILRQFEFGGNVKASSPFTVPLPGQRRLLRRLIDKGGKGRPFVLNNASNRGLLIREVGKAGRNRSRTELLGWVRDRRQQRPILGFFTQFDSVFARDSATFDKAIDAVIRIAERTAAETPGQPLDVAGVAAAFATWEREHRTRVPTYRQAKAAREALAASKALDSTQPLPPKSGGTGGGA